MVVLSGGAPAETLPGTPLAMILGFRIHAFDSYDDMLARIGGRKTILVALNAEKLARGDDAIRAITNRSVGYADGYGAVLAVRRKGGRTARLAGADLWLHLARHSPDGTRFYLMGSTAEIVEMAVARLRSEVPGIQIVGFRDGFLGPDDEAGLGPQFESLRPDVVFVAMGSPRQELLMDRLLRAWPALYVGLGGSLDVYVGRRRRAPRLIQRLGLEWAFRFVVDPRRLHRLPAYVRFAWLLARGRI